MGDIRDNPISRKPKILKRLAEKPWDEHYLVMGGEEEERN